ncbi:unnamed protein product [Somion occarium]|uniref:C2H2-type domain-containing protein n=1 Tax=Somion occarium TaxID=3059160 RepID=A0ABP1DHP2_9APHY
MSSTRHSHLDALNDYHVFKEYFPLRSLRDGPHLHGRWLDTPVKTTMTTDLRTDDHFPFHEQDIVKKIEWVLAQRGVSWEQYNPAFPHRKGQKLVCPIPGCQVGDSTGPQALSKHLRTIPHMVILAKYLGLTPDVFFTRRLCKGCKRSVYIQRQDSWIRHSTKCKAKHESGNTSGRYASGSASPGPRAVPYSPEDRPFQKRFARSMANTDSQVESQHQPGSHVFPLELDGRPSTPVSPPQFSAGCFALDPSIGTYPSPWAGTLAPQTPTESEPQTPPEFDNLPPVSIQTANDPGYFHLDNGYYTSQLYSNELAFMRDVLGETSVGVEYVSQNYDSNSSLEFSGSYLGVSSSWTTAYPLNTCPTDALGLPILHSCHVSPQFCYACSFFPQES